VPSSPKTALGSLSLKELKAAAFEDGCKSLLNGKDEKKMPEITDAGMYKEWWANPAVVGLMGFGTTTMATGLHNVGYWGIGPTLALAIAFGGTAQFVRGSSTFGKEASSAAQPS